MGRLDSVTTTDAGPLPRAGEQPDIADRPTGRGKAQRPPGRRLPNTLNISVTAVTGNHLLAAVAHLVASTGSACHSSTTEPSPVLTAMGADPDRALGAVRLSLGRWTTTTDIDHAAELPTTTADDLRSHPAGTTNHH